MKESINYRGKVIEIIQDTDAQSPSEWGDEGLFLVANHRDFYVPEPGEKRVPNDPAELVERWQETHHVLPIEAYIHSGVHLSFSREGNYPDRRWDVSQLGFLFASKAEWPDAVKAKEAGQVLLGEWNKYLSGDVWGYVVGDDSCWGFYGYDYCVEQAKEIADHQIAKEHKARLELIKQFIRNHVPLAVRWQKIQAA